MQHDVRATYKLQQHGDSETRISLACLRDTVLTKRVNPIGGPMDSRMQPRGDYDSRAAESVRTALISAVT